MNENNAATATPAGASVPGAKQGTSIQHGEHTDTIETVNAVFVEQRRLSFTYGAIFFGVTLAIPALSIWAPAWYATPVWGGFTANYFFVSLLYFFFLWAMAWTYSKQADKLDQKLMTMADKFEAKAKGGEGS